MERRRPVEREPALEPRLGEPRHRERSPAKRRQAAVKRTTRPLQRTAARQKQTLV